MSIKKPLLDYCEISNQPLKKGTPKLVDVTVDVKEAFEQA